MWPDPPSRRLKELDEPLASMRVMNRAIKHPSGGWLRAAREAIGASSTSVATKLGITRQAYGRIEAREPLGTVTLDKLGQAAAAMDCELVYFLLPRAEAGETFTALAARHDPTARHLKAVEHSMLLEGQQTMEPVDHVNAGRDPALEEAQPHPGQTSIDENERRDLIPSVVSRAHLNRLELLNIHSARLWAMSPRVLRRDDLLTDGFARELHRRMFAKVWKWAGRYRTAERNLGWEAHRIPSGVRTALDDAAYWLEHQTYPPHEAAVRLHHRLVVVHPWPNGNGRHARLLADVIVAAQKERPLSWGGAQVEHIGPSATRQRYIHALRQADQENFAPLLEFCR